MISWYSEHNIDVSNSIGIDEVGRGPLAGPVVAVAVWINGDILPRIEHEKLIIRDSKKMSQKQRQKVLNWIELQDFSMIKYAIGFASSQEIDDINILNATFLAMRRAYESLDIKVQHVLIDGNKSPDLKDVNVIPVVGGDNKVLSIALSSIIAKEFRDDWMKNLAQKFPHYGWHTNVGYGSKEHINAILNYGITTHHRKTFAPIKELLHILPSL